MATQLPERAGELDLIIEQGATFDPILTWRDENGALVDVTGYSARMQIRDTIDATTTLVDLTSAAGDIVLGAAAGTIQIIISATDTALFAWEDGVYDLEMIEPGGAVRRLVRGSVAVSPEVTR